jgi:hypothetical protein
MLGIFGKADIMVHSCKPQCQPLPACIRVNPREDFGGGSRDVFLLSFKLRPEEF